MNTLKSLLLSQTSFSILLALSIKPLHGYALMKQTQSDSAGRINMGAGTLYGALKQLNQSNFIEEAPSYSGNSRRREYRLTKKGWDYLNSELQYFDTVVRLARERYLLQSEE